MPRLLGASLLAQFPWAFAWLVTSSRTARVKPGVPTIIDSVAIRLDDMRWWESPAASAWWQR